MNRTPSLEELRLLEAQDTKVEGQTEKDWDRYKQAKFGTLLAPFLFDINKQLFEKAKEEKLNDPK